jgi:chromosomal replication initiator protein
MKQQILEFPVDSLSTFDSFVVCDGNAAALQFARRIVDIADSDKLLYLHGPSGSGKTHLIKSVRQELAINGTGNVAYLSCKTPISFETVAATFEKSSALLIDDLHLLPDDADVRASLWQVFNDYYIAGRPIVMAGLYPPRELPHIDDHLVSRLLWGLVARVDASDDHSRMMILKKVADDRQVRVPDDVVDYILITTSREVGELIDTFEAIYRLSLAEKRKITLALAKESRELVIAGGL